MVSSIFFEWSVLIPQNLQMRVLMCYNKDPNTLKKSVFIQSNNDPKIKATCAQIDILNGLDLKGIEKGRKVSL